MSGDDEGFLARWSRRKSTADGEQEASPADRPGEESSSDNKPIPKADDAPDARQPDNEEPFDLSSLPSIESIGAETDLTPFFRPGVPSALKHAALRRVWVTDPAIRDFVGLQEYDWDYVTGDIPGFGPIGPDVDVRAMAEQLFGGGKKAEQVEQAAVSESPDEAPRASPDSQNIDRSESNQPPELVRREENAASQTEESKTPGTQSVLSQRSDDSEEPERPVRARRHGSALPS